MNKSLSIAVLTLVAAMASTAAFAESVSSTAKSEQVTLHKGPGGLSCFTIDPPPLDPHNPISCDDFCEGNAAICTGVTSPLSPAQSCADAAAHFTTICRCCMVKP